MSEEKLTFGTVAAATAGRDKGRMFVVLRIENGKAFIADGKTRKLCKPKCKNIKHLKPTTMRIPTDGLTDKSLRKLLNAAVQKENTTQDL